MARKRRTYTPEFKAEAVKLVTEQGDPLVEAARSLGTHEALLRCHRGSAASCRRDALRRELARVGLHRAAWQRCEHDANRFTSRVGPAERAG